MFRDSSVEKVNLPETAASGVVIGQNSFTNCSQLKEISIPEGIKEIGAYAFHNCGITDVYYGGSEEDWNNVDIKSGNDILSSDDVEFHFGIKLEEKKSEKFDVTASYMSNAFNE